MAPRPENKTMTLPEIGKKLSGGVSQKEALLKLLKAAASQLQEVQQSAGVSTTAAIKPCVQALVKPQYLKHKDKDVRLLSAFCCSEAMRVFAPDPPYSDPELKEIFQLFVAIFHRLDEVQSPSFNRIVGILETLAKVKTCIVMLDLELDSLILEMFQILFRKISVEHPRNVHTAMLDVMGTIIDESEDVSQTLLDTILMHLVERARDKSPAAYQLAVGLVQRCADHLQPIVQRLLTTVMQNPEAVESEVKQDYYELIYEIYKAAPQILVAVLPSMLEEVRKEDDEKRLKAVDVLGKIFSLPEQHAHQDYRQLYAEFMKRYMDKSVDIRVKMMEWSQSYLLNTQAPDAADHFAALAGRLLDIDDKSRLQAVKVICHLARTKPKIVPTDVLKEVAERIRDKKVPVRRIAQAEFAKIYRHYCIRCSEGKESFSGEFEWIPNRLLLCCFDKEVKEFKPQAFDLFLDEELFPVKLPVENRARHWISILAAMEEKQAQVLTSLFKMKARTQQEMANYLEVRRKLKEEDTPELQKQLQMIFNNVAAAFVDSPKAAEHMKKLHQLKDNNIFKALGTLMDRKSTFAQARATREELMKRLGEKHPQQEFIRDLATKISFMLFGEEHVQATLKLIREKKLADPELVSASMKLLVEVSTHFPMLFESFQAHLVKMLTEGDSTVKDGAANILGKAGGHLRDLLTDSSGTVSETLQKLAVEGTRQQAKHAIEAIASLSEDEGLKDLSVLYQRLVDSLENDGVLPTVFQSLGSIAQHAMPVFETREDDIIKFVVRTILRRKSDHYMSDQGKARKFDWDNPSPVCQLKVQGLKVLVKSFLPLKDVPARPRLRGLLNVLSKLIPMGELNEDQAKESTEVDRAHIRLAAAKAVLRLARRYDPYIQSQLPNLFSLTMLTAQDPCFQVRQKMVAKVHQYLHLRDSPLPHKYACCFALDAIDVEKANVNMSKRYLAEFVESSRREAVIRQVRAVGVTVEGSTITFLPEYVLVYLVHVLAHHPDFPTSEALTAESYEPFIVQLEAFIRALLLLDGESKGEVGKKEEADSLPAILAILRTIKNVPGDAVDGSKTELLYTVCDIGIMVAKELGRKKLYSGEYPGAIPLPLALYSPLEDSAEEGAEGTIVTLEKVDGSHLPKCLLEEAPKPKPKPAALPRPALTMASSKGKKRVKSEEKDSQETDNTDTAAASVAMEPPQKKTRNGDISADVKSTKTTPKSRPKAAPVQTPKTAPPPTGPAAESTPAPRSTPRSTVKSPPQERKSAGAELVGRTIKVWWPLDKAFYSGLVESYDEKKRTHHVKYEDGDKESLNLLKERWEVTDGEEAGAAAVSSPVPASPAGATAPPATAKAAASAPKAAATGGKKGAAGSPAKGKAGQAEAAAEKGKSPEGKRKREAGEEEAQKKGKAQKAKGKAGAGQAEPAKNVGTNGEPPGVKGKAKGKGAAAVAAAPPPREEAVEMEMDTGAGAGAEAEAEAKQGGRGKGKAGGSAQTAQANGEAKGRKRKEPEAAKAPVRSAFDYTEKDEGAEKGATPEPAGKAAKGTSKAGEASPKRTKEVASKAKAAKESAHEVPAAAKPVAKKAAGGGGKKGAGKKGAESKPVTAAVEEVEKDKKEEEETKEGDVSEPATETPVETEAAKEGEAGAKAEEQKEVVVEKKVEEKKEEPKKAGSKDPARRLTRGRAGQEEVALSDGSELEVRLRKAPAKDKAAGKKGKQAVQLAAEGGDKATAEVATETAPVKEAEREPAATVEAAAEGKSEPPEGESAEVQAAEIPESTEKETEEGTEGTDLETPVATETQEGTTDSVQSEEPGTAETATLGLSEEEKAGPSETETATETEEETQQGSKEASVPEPAGGEEQPAEGAEKVNEGSGEEEKEKAGKTEGAEATDGAPVPAAAAAAGQEDDEPVETVRSRRRRRGQ